MIALSIGLIVAGVVGCAGGRMVRVESDSVPELRENEAFLIVHMDTDISLDRVYMHFGSVAKDLPEGDHLWILRMRAGDGSWERIGFGKHLGRRRSVNLEAIDLPNEEEFDFEIEPGVINYPGTLIVRSEVVPGLKRLEWTRIRNRNHSARVVRRLIQSHPELLRSRSIRYSGSGRDEFLTFYTSELADVDPPGEPDGEREEE